MAALKRTPYLLFAALIFAFTALADDDWKTDFFDGPIDAVWNAAVKVASSKHEVKSRDDALHIIRFHVGTTAWSWGYNMTLRIEEVSPNHCRASVEIEKSGGPAFSWGSGKKEVGKIFKAMRKELALSKLASLSERWLRGDHESPKTEYGASLGSDSPRRVGFVFKTAATCERKVSTCYRVGRRTARLRHGDG